MVSLHSMRRCLVTVILGAVAASTAAAQAPLVSRSAGPALPPELEQAKTALARFQDPLVALGEGYLSTLVCIEFPRPSGPDEFPYPAGAMGVHFLNPALIGPPLDPAKPQVLIYEPVGDKLQLIAAEWFAPVQPGATAAPQIFGRSLEGPMHGHRPIMPDELHHWDLHVWLWKANPAGVYASTNPNVRCPTGGYTTQGTAHKVVAH
jgi:hypothetical protein